MSNDIKQNILDNLDDSITRFLYYDRREDSSLPVGAIEDAVRKGDIAISDMIKLFVDRICDI